MELEVTLRRALRVFWEFLWRIVGMGFVIGLLTGILGAFLGMPYERMVQINIIVGLIASLPLTYVSLWAILGKRFGKFRLVLVDSQVRESRGGGGQAG